MKFSQLPIGARFEFEGRVYVKTGPIAAASEEGGPRMIPRYAVLRPLDGSASAPGPRAPRSLDEATVLEAFEVFHGECRRLLEGGTGAAPLRELAAARERFMAALAHRPGKERE
jgi:hypothetical protein